MSADKATLPPPAPAEQPQRRLLSKKFAINAIAILTGIIATAAAYTALSMVVGMGLGAGAMYQSESVRLATGIPLAGADFVPPIGSVASILLAAVVLSVPLGAVVCGRVAYLSTRRLLAARFTTEG